MSSEADKEERKRLAREAILKQNLPPREKVRMINELVEKEKKEKQQQ